MVKEAFELGYALGLMKQAMGASEILRRLSDASLRRLGRSAVLSKARFSAPGKMSRTPAQLEAAANRVAQTATPIYELPGGESAVGAGMNAWELAQAMQAAGRQSANLHRIRGALKSRMEGGPFFLP
jgi:hypothetical protein